MTSVESKLAWLRAHLLEVNDLQSAAALLHWDQTTYMPPKGAVARGRQLATLNSLGHAKFIDSAVGQLLDGLGNYEESLSFDSDNASLIRVTRREYHRAVKVPTEFTARLNSHTAASYSTWAEARVDNNFRAVRPYLEKTLDLSRELAEFFPGYAHIADPLIDLSENLSYSHQQFCLLLFYRKLYTLFLVLTIQVVQIKMLQDMHVLMQDQFVTSLCEQCLREEQSE